jgi:DNA-binding ferritin-like protein (Dps family)
VIDLELEEAVMEDRGAAEVAGDQVALAETLREMSRRMIDKKRGSVNQALLVRTAG